MKIHIVQGSRLDGMDYNHWNVKAFKLKYDATLYQDRISEVYKKLAKFYSDRYHKCQLNNDDWEFSDYERTQKYSLDVEFHLEEIDLL